ncbi:hypothetical protein ACFW04_014569 [Cataglyphis niger]
MEENKVHFRHLMLFFYRKGKNATQAANKISWFARFKAGDFNLEDQERPDRPSITDEDQIKTLIENNLRYMTRKLAEMLNMSKSTIHEHFKNLMDRISICDSLYKRNEETPFLKQVVTGDKKWIIYNNVKRKRSWGKRNEPPLATTKVAFTKQREITINSEKYSSQLDELETAIEQKNPEIANRKGVVFHQDNARSHVSLIIRQKLL